MAEEKKLTKEEIIGAIGSLTVLELNELVKALEERFGVSAQPVVAAAVAPAAGVGEATPAEEKTEFNVILADAGANKIGVIKAVRTINQALGLKEAKDLVESAPKAVLEKAKKDEAEAAKKTLEEAGAKVELK